MKSISVLLAAALSIMSAHAAPSAKPVSWKQVYDGPDYELNIDPASLVVEDDQIVVVETKVRSKEDTKTMRDMKIEHMLVRARFDCKVDGRFQFITLGVVTSGEEGTYGLDADTRWLTFASTTPEAIMGRAACDLAKKPRKKKRS